MRFPQNVVAISALGGVLLGTSARDSFPAAGPAVADVAPTDARSDGLAGPFTEALANDNRQSAISRGATTLTIAIVDAIWRPEGDEGPSLTVWAFAVDGEPARIPGPLLRHLRGEADVHITFVNRVRDSVDVHGFTSADAPLVLAPGASHVAILRAQRAGNFLYWGARHGSSFDERMWVDGQLAGAVVIDTPEERRRAQRVGDRVMVVTESFRFDTVQGREEVLAQLALNGRSWPHTERLAYTVNDSVHWRFLNGSTIAHPMHLHGFYFRVSRAGMFSADAPVPTAHQALRVTEYVEPGGTMSLSFTPREPGNWVFHCHFAAHVNGVASTDSAFRALERSRTHAADGRHMGGLVMAIQVHSDAPSPEVVPTRQLHLVIDHKGTPFSHGGAGYAFALADSVEEHGAQALPPERRQVPGPVLLLKRGERVAITLHNRLARPTSVHWHGLEIESFPDGVPHLSGRGTRLLHPVRPHDSLTVEFTPPRSGTFMYHSHFSEAEQMNGGLYGAIVVLDDPASFNPSRDHVIVVGGGGIPTTALGFESPWTLVNGRTSPPPIVMRVGETHRLRLASIHPDWDIRVTLGSEERTWTWTPVARDGADLPRALRAPTAATWHAGPGQVADFEVTATAAGSYRLLVRSEASGWAVVVPVTVSR